MKTYKDIYEFPLKNHWGRVWDNKNNFVFQFEFENKEKQELLLNVINGKENLKNMELDFIHKNGEIYGSSNKEIPCILIRGWGNLTGIGGHNLPAEEAANIQDTFAEYIVKRLNFRE